MPSGNVQRLQHRQEEVGIWSIYVEVVDVGLGRWLRKGKIVYDFCYKLDPSICGLPNLRFTPLKVTIVDFLIRKTCFAPCKFVFKINLDRCAFEVKRSFSSNFSLALLFGVIKVVILSKIMSFRCESGDSSVIL